MKLYSEYFNVPHDKFVELGVYDAYVDMDSQLHIDPSLIKKTSIPEFVCAYEKFIKYFDNICHLAPHVKYCSKLDRFYKQICRLLTFKELPNTGLGYSGSNSGGSGISGKLSSQLAGSAVEIIQKGIEDPVIFEIMPFIEEGIGPDRISDMTLRILAQNFILFTQRICSEMGIETQIFTKSGTEERYALPAYNNKPIIFVPNKFLLHLPTADSWDDIDTVCNYNAALRARIAKAIGLSWKEVKALSKNKIKEILLNDIDLFNGIISMYKQHTNKPYNFEEDRLGLDIKNKLPQNLTKDYPLEVASSPTTVDMAYDVAIKICNHFKELIEDNGLYRQIMNEDGSYKHESAAQLFFFAIADVYCRANDIDLNREVNAGVGALDFKLSRGYNCKINIEIKYTRNDVEKGYKNQLPAYNRAEKAHRSIYLVIRNSNNDEVKLNKLQHLVEQNNNEPTAIIIDARTQPSASKRK